MFKIGAKVIWLVTGQDSSTRVLRQGTVSKVHLDTIWVDSKHKPEDCLYAAFAHADTPDARLLLQDILDTEARHKLELKDLMAAQFKLINKQNTEGLR